MKLIESDSITFYYCDELSDIEVMTSILKKLNCIALDTEVRPLIEEYGDKANTLDPHTSIIRLIQWNYMENKYPYVIDVMKIGVEECRPFVNELCRPSLLKVIHQAKYDLKQFKSTFGVRLLNVHCSMVTMQTLGLSTGWQMSRLRGHSLKSLARDYADIHLDKLEGTSDWSAFNLTPSQLEYAAWDVAPFLLEAYFTIREVLESPKGYDEKDAFELDQKAMAVLERVEYKGMHIDPEMFSYIKEKSKSVSNDAKLKLCSSLGFNIEQEIQIINGIPTLIPVIPNKIATLLNDNKGLVKYVNNVLHKKGDKTLTSLQATELEETMGELEKEKNMEDEDDDNITLEENNELKDYGIDLIKHLLIYKKFNKIYSDIKKYELVINPKTGCLHADFMTIGAGTGRMSSSGDFNAQQVNTLKFELEVPKTYSILQGLDKGVHSFKMMVSMKNIFAPKKKRIKIVCDYSQQELRVAAAISGDLEMLKTYFMETTDPFLIRDDTGEKYPNPLVDLHIVAALALSPDLADVPLWELLAATEAPLPGGDTIRKIAKIFNFS